MKTNNINTPINKRVGNHNGNIANNKLIPLLTYTDADLDKYLVYKENKNKTGIYRWIHKKSNKTYVGSAVDLAKRLKNYYNISYLERAVEKNNSLIYKALLKYGYSSFSLDILEYCDTSVLIKREQYYIDFLKPEYNILKFAGSLMGFKHSKEAIERMCFTRSGKFVSEATKLKIAINSVRAHSLKVINISTGDVKIFTSIRSTAKFISVHHSYLAKYLKRNNLYVGKGYKIVLNK